MFSISTSLQRICFVHPHSGVLLTLLRLLTSIHLSGALACTLVICPMLGELIVSNRWVRSLAFLWCACHFFVRYTCRLCFRWASRFISRCAGRCGETAELEGRLAIISTPPHLSRNPKGIREKEQFWLEERRKRVRRCDTTRPCGSTQLGGSTISWKAHRRSLSQV